MSIKSTKEEFIRKAEEKHGKGRYDYSKVKYKDSKTKITIICPIHGEFEQTPSSHLSGCGCPHCAGNIKSNTEEFIRKAEEIHGIGRYDYSKVDYKNNSAKVTIICPIHGEFEQLPNHHLGGCGCVYCSNERNRSNTEEFIRKAEEIHGIGRYDYSRVEYKNNSTKVTIICPIHGEFEQTPNAHLSGRGCPYCYRSNTEEFIRKAEEIHGIGRYDYSRVDYKNANTKVTIICPIHGEFEQRASSHLNGQGCPNCSNERNRSNTEEFIRKAEEIHGKGKYDYSRVDYCDSFTKVTIICPIHGEFEQRASSHLNGQGCPNCAIERNRSNTEEFIKKAREVHGNKYDYSKVDYKNAKTKITIICPEHGEFEQKPNGHLIGHGCPVCCASRPKLDNTQSSHCVYIFDFPNKTRYVGLTMKSIEVRENEHRNGRVRSNGTYTSSVYKYSIEFNVPIPKPSIFKDNLTPEEAQYWEGWVIEDSKQNGYTLLNVAKAGGLGGYTY